MMSKGRIAIAAVLAAGLLPIAACSSDNACAAVLARAGGGGGGSHSSSGGSGRSYGGRPSVRGGTARIANPVFDYGPHPYIYSPYFFPYYLYGSGGRC